MGAAEKVIQLHENRVYEDIQAFLAEKGQQSEQTQIAYEKDIRDFSERVFGKLPNFLTADDLKGITRNKILAFRNDLVKSEDYSNKTINRRVQTVRNLYQYLDEVMKYNFGHNPFLQLKKLPENDNEYGVLSIEEVEKIVRWLRENEREKKEVKAMLVLMAVDTGFRLNALLKLTWDDIVIEDGKIRVHAIDKGSKDNIKNISEEFYNELLKIKVEGQSQIFKISKEAVHEMMNRVREGLNFPTNRNIVFHSFRKTGATFHFRITGDILSTMEFATHSDPKTTLRYIAKEDNNYLGAYSMSKDLDLNIINNVPHEVLLSVIEQHMSKDVKVLLALKLKEYVDKN